MRFLALLSLILTLPAAAAELQKKTSNAYDHYVQATEIRIAGEMGDANNFLWVDRQPEPRRKELLALLAKGQVVVHHMETRESGKEIPIPDGMVHHSNSSVGHSLARKYSGSHVGDFFANQSKVGDHLAKRFALLGVCDSALDAVAGRSNASGPQLEAAHV